MKKLNKTAFAAIIIVTVLAAAFGTGLGLILHDNKEYRELYENELIKINLNGEELGIFTFGQLAELCGGINEFNAVYKPSRKEPIERKYEGLELKGVLAALGIDIAELKSVSFRASDGYPKVFPLSDIQKDNEVFIAVKYGGREFIRGIKPSGSTYPDEDGGPFVVIKASDVFSNDRVRGLVEINVTLL